MRKHERVPTIDGQNNYRQMRINMPPEKDLFCAKRDKDSPADVRVLEGDSNIGQITDFLHFWRKWISGLGPPAAHLGYVDDVSRSVITDLHVVFARRGRRMQTKFMAGLHHLYWIHLILAGYDPREIDYCIWPPSLGTKDEVMASTIQLAHSNTVKNLSAAFSTTGEAPGPKWYLKYILGMSDDVLEEMELTPVIQQAGGQGGEDTPVTATANNSEREKEMAHVAFQDPNTVKDARLIGSLIAERAMAMRNRELLLPEEKIVLKPSTPFVGDIFEHTVRTLLPVGRRNLKRVR